MSRRSAPLTRLCQRCFQCKQQKRAVTTGGTTPNRQVPLRIFAEDDVKDITSLYEDEATKAKREQRYQDWLARIPPDERLAKEVKRRVGKRQERGLLEILQLAKSREDTIWLSRIRSGYKLGNVHQVTPADLLQPPENIGTEETIFEAIEACILAAIERLELYSSGETGRVVKQDRTSVPHDQYMWLSNILEFQFAKQQLIDYGRKYGVKSMYRKTRTVNIIKMILDEVWKLDKESEMPPDETLVTKSLSHGELN
jgi:hypothetical protein